VNPQPKNQRKKKIGLNKVRTEALTAMQLLRRLEESDDNGNVMCISCCKTMHYKQAQGGHYIPRRHRATELEKDNIFPQCARCNGFMEGNSIGYRDALKITIGQERLDRLEDMHRASQGDEEAMQRLSISDQIAVLSKKTVSDYLEIRDECRAKIKIEKERIGE